jgi:hypothetical protein
MVTPPYKDGFPAIVQGISEGGSQLYLQSFGAFAGAENTGEFGENYVVSRTPGGWAVEPFGVSLSMFSGFLTEVVSPDFKHSLWVAYPTPQSAIPNIYLGAPPHGPFQEVGPDGPSSFGERTLVLVGTSQNLSHSFYVALAPSLGSKSPLWPGDKTVDLGQSSLYEYSGTENREPRLVGISNVGPAPSIAASNLISECGTDLGGLVHHRENAYNAVSAGGNTVFFTALGHDYGVCAPEGTSFPEPEVNEIHARINGSESDAHTVAISEPEPVDCGECKLAEPRDAEYQGASSDGSTVFFTTEQHLLSTTTETGPDLYEYDFRAPEGGRVTRISAGDPAGARVQHVLRVSNDGSHVYFTAQGVLTSTGNAFGRHAEGGSENIYVYERDATYPRGYIAFIGVGNVPVAQTTPDGRFLVFQSAADLTPDEGEQAEAAQVFEYDATTAQLTRVSRGESGYNNDGNSNAYAATIPRQQFPTSDPIAKLNGVAVSDDGASVFFTTADALTPQTQDGTMNVYEYREGHVALISDGHDRVEVDEGPAVNLLGTDGSGEDVFFETADPLVPQDSDTQLDIYDARIAGGFPAPAPSPSCSSDSCQGALSGGLQPSAPPTSSSGGESLAATSAVPNTGKAGAKPKPRKAKKKPKKRGKRSLRKAKKAARRGGR